MAKAPSTKQEIISYYNNVISKAYSGKVGLHKERYTDNVKMDAPPIADFYVKKFMSIGEKYRFNETYEKGKWPKYEPMNAGRLTVNDVVNATCKESGANYNIVISIRDSSTKASETSTAKKPNDPIDKCGISVGTEDKNEYDHKSADVIYSAVKGTISDTKISENVNGIIINASVNASNGQLASLKIDWNVKVDMDFTYKMVSFSANATGTTHITYSDFRY